jgi:hypothetical protein
MLVKLLPLDLEEIIVRHIDVEGNSTKKWRGSFTIFQLYKLEHLVSNDRILVVLEHNPSPLCLMLIVF